MTNGNEKFGSFKKVNFVRTKNECNRSSDYFNRQTDDSNRRNYDCSYW